MKSEHSICLFIKQTVLFIIILFSGSFSVFAQTRNAVSLSPASFKPSSEFRVTVNGINVLVYSSPVPASFCSFDMDKPVDIVIKSLIRDVKWVDVRPLSAGIRSIINKDSSITFRIYKTGQYSIELNGVFKIPLFLFANAPEINKPDRADKNILYFGAGKIHYPGTINLNDNQQIYIEGGAIVVGNVRARNVHHIEIRGHGILDGSYSRHFMDSCALTNGTNKNGDVMLKESGVNGFISISESSDILIEGITIYNSKTWDVVPVLCNNVNINNIKIVSDNGGDDGIDIVSSKSVIVGNSFIRTKDDCIAIKSFAKPVPIAGQNPASKSRTDQRSFGQLDPGPFYGVDSVTVKNCVFWNALWGNGIEIGYELSGDVTNIRFTDNDVIHVEGGAAFSIHNARRGIVNKVLVDDLRVEYADQKLFDLAIFRSVYSEDGTRYEEEINRLYLNGVWDNVLRVTEEENESHEKFRGHIRDITLKNVSVIDGPSPFSVFYGSDINHLVENIKIENLTIHGRKIKEITDAKLYLENIKNIIIK